MASKLFIRKFYTSNQVIRRSITCLPHDWRFNSIIITNDIYDLLLEMVFQYCSMEASHEVYISSNPKGKNLSDYDFFINLFAGQLILQIPATREKLGLSCACYFSYKNLNKDLGYYLEDLEKMLSMKYKNDPLRVWFLKFIKTTRKPHWNNIIKYRHMKTHRLDVKISAYNVEEHHGWGLMKQISHADAMKYAISAFESGPKEREGMSDLYKKKQIDFYLSNLRINGRYFMRIPEKRLIDYASTKKSLYKCLKDLFLLSDEYFNILSKRSFEK